PQGKSGLATLTAKLLDQGTSEKTAVELAEALEMIGGGIGVSAGDDQTRIGVGATTRNFAAKLAIVGKMLAAPRFDSADVERERHQQLADLLQGPDDPQWIASRVFPMLLFGTDHPYGNPDQGYTRTVRTLTTDDVRAFRKRWFVPKGSTLL